MKPLSDMSSGEGSFWDTWRRGSDTAKRKSEREGLAYLVGLTSSELRWKASRSVTLDALFKRSMVLSRPGGSA